LFGLEMERLRSCFFEAIPLSALTAAIPCDRLEQLIPSIIFYGSQEHGTTLLLEHFIHFPLPQKLRMRIEVCIRSTERSFAEPNLNQIEVLDAQNNVLPELTVLVPFPSSPAAADHDHEDSALDESFYENLYLKAKRILEERGEKSQPHDLTLRLWLYSANSPLVNVRFLPLECEGVMNDSVTTAATAKTQTYFCFVLSVFTNFRLAGVNKIYFDRQAEVWQHSLSILTRLSLYLDLSLSILISLSV
jgi:hypothetical protein